MEKRPQTAQHEGKVGIGCKTRSEGQPDRYHNFIKEMETSYPRSTDELCMIDNTSFVFAWF